MPDIREVDLTDEVLLRRLWEIGAEADAEVPAVHDHPSWMSWRARFTRRDVSAARRLLAAYDDDQPAGYAEVSLPLLDNPRLAEVGVYVAREARRRGHGSALLGAVVDDARRADRSLLMTGLSTGIDEVPVGQLFAEARGFTLAQYDVEKRLDIAAHRASWPVMLDDVAGRSDGYEVDTWVGQTPDRHLGALCALMSSFNGEIPLGELDLEEEYWDPARLRDQERRRLETGRHGCVSIAIAPDGTPAGYTEIVVDDGWPGIAFQEGTLVVPGHRGRRLGLRLKLINQLRMVRDFPDVGTIEAGNAADNDHMNAVNEVLGFRPVARWLELQRRL